MYKIDSELWLGENENGLPITIFGNTYYNKGIGYLIISSGDNQGKSLHSLIYYYVNGGNYLKKDLHIHHINGNKLDNRIDNLEALTKSEHHKLHNSNRKHSDLDKFKNSLKNNISNYNNLPFRVCKYQNYFKYQYFDNEGNRKALTAKTLPELRNKALEANQIWLQTLEDMKIVYKLIGGRL